MQSIIDSIEELNARPAPADTEESQAGLLDYLDGILANTETMLTAVEATGVPDVDNGQAIAEGVVDGLRQVEATFRTARKRIAEAPTEDPEAYDATVQDALGPGFESGLADAQASLEALQSGELSVVGGNEPECQRIQELQRKLA